VDRTLPDRTRAEWDAALATQYRQSLADLAMHNAKAPKVALAIDATHELASSKYLNNAYAWHVRGQQNTWVRALEYSCIYDTTHQLYVGCMHHDYRLSSEQKKSLRPAVQELLDKCAVVRSAGCEVAVIEGDRGYFGAEIFAAASLGLFTPGAAPTDCPRVVMPRKFTRGKEKFKWDFLTDDKLPPVFVDHLNLNPYTHGALRGQCEGVFAKNDTGRYQVPYVNVAVVDEYTADRSRTVAEAREEARRVQAGIQETK
jgi:hypothetical protein